MTKSELIKKMSQKFPSINPETINKMVDVIISELVEALAAKQRIEIRGFGSFLVKKRSSRVARNPKTNEIVVLEERYVPCFKTGKGFHERINAQIQ